MATACRLIEAAEEVPSLDVLAQAADMSRFHFHRVFKAVTGVTPKAYAAAHRGNRVREELAARDTVTQAIYGAGFNSGSRFYAASSGLLGMTPTEFRAGGSGNVIRFAVGECSLGADPGRGDGQGRLRHRPRRRSRPRWCAACRTVFRTRGWSVATPPSSNSSPRWSGFVDAPAQGLDLPLDIRGTAFQRRVWDAIRGIPAGSTASYSEIARRIGAPKAVRSVAQACASNAIAVAIPCHRVVRTDGSALGLPLGRCAQARPAGAGGEGMTGR